MNKYELNGALSPADRAAKVELNKFYNKFHDHVIANKKKNTLGNMREEFEALSPADAKKVLEYYNNLEGALSGELEEEYIKIVYSIENIEAKMESEAKSFYEVISAIAWETKNAHIILDSELVKKQVDAVIKERAAKTEKEFDPAF